LLAGEFEKHEACWMGWPYDGGLWRDNAKPAQEQYANVAKAISEFEPLIMLADPEVRPPPPIQHVLSSFVSRQIAIR